MFAEEIKLKADWNAYLEEHPVGTTERKWDKAMRKQVTDRIDLLAKAKERTAKRRSLAANRCVIHMSMPHGSTIKQLLHCISSEFELYYASELPVAWRKAYFV